MKTWPSAFFAWLLLGLCFSYSPGEEATSTTSPSRPPGGAEGRTYYYWDDQGLSVSTTAARMEHPILGGLLLRIQTLADWIVLKPYGAATGAAPGDTTHHDHTSGTTMPVDAVTGASSRASGGGGTTRELRGEGVVGLRKEGDWRGRPTGIAFDLRASHEPDYQSFAGALSGDIELNNGNTTLSASMGYGHDRISPTTPPPGQKSLWPASHEKWFAGFGFSQTLTPRVQASTGLSASLQRGTLSSPYRRALVHTTLFPEALPDERIRVTAYVQSSVYLGLGTALHARMGTYWDDWGILGWIPEAALAKETGERGMATLRFRWYDQTAATFYSPLYHTLEATRSGDPRLGSVVDRTVGFEYQHQVRGDVFTPRPVFLTAGYTFSFLEFNPALRKEVQSHVLSLGLSLKY